ncbi:MAG TPA: DUF2306 domain-containing protein [Rhizomicrobium sp.]|jgi:uncharacterized membrane protein|nr:DUF2306 domain-containing protein [Rhizomicrobium sp.]
MLLTAAHTSSIGLLTMAGFALHIGAGTVALFSGTIAIFARKGGRLHRRTGTVFFASMLIMAASAAYLAVVRPGQIINLFGGTFAFYLVTTGWMAAARRDGKIGLPEKIAMGVAICLCVPFALVLVQTATGMTIFKSAFAIKGPILIAMYVFASVVGIAALSDAKVVWAGGITGAPRIARHLWRMCLGLTMAAGSAFTNGLPRLLPGPMHVTGIFFLPQFIPMVLLVFWMVRVRLTGWRWRAPAQPPVSGAEFQVRAIS